MLGNASPAKPSCGTSHGSPPARRPPRSQKAGVWLSPADWYRYVTGRPDVPALLHLEYQDRAAGRARHHGCRCRPSDANWGHAPARRLASERAPACGRSGNRGIARDLRASEGQAGRPPRLNPRTVQRHSPCWSRREVALALPQRRRFGLWKRVRAAPGQSPRDGACQVPANGCNAAEGGLIDGEAQFSLLNAGDRSDRRFPARGAPRGGPGAPRERCRARA